MRKFFRKMFSSLGTSLIGIHLIGVGISFAVFSYQYAREHGFMSWLIFGEVVPALKSVVWEVFLVVALIQSPVQSPPITSITQNLMTSPVTGEDERTGYWWEKRSDSDKLSYIAGFADGLNFTTGMVTPWVDIGLHPEQLSDTNKDEITELWIQRASEFTQIMKCFGEFSGNELEQDLNGYYKADKNREVSIGTAIWILEIEPRIIPDWLLEQRINELKRSSKGRYDYLKKKYLEEKLRRKKS